MRKMKTFLFVLFLGVIPSGSLLFAQRYIDLNKVEGDLYVYGEEKYDHVGDDVGVVNLNGDGVGDLVVATTIWNGAYQKPNYVYFGSKHPVPNRVIDVYQDPADVTILTRAGTYWNASLARGDINGDGLEDLVLGEPSYPGSGIESDKGYVCVILGGPKQQSGEVIDLEQEAPYLEIFGWQHNGFAGCSVACGDVNGDGFDDVVIGAYNTDTWGAGGAVYVVYGAPDFPPGYQVDLSDGYDLVLSGESLAGGLGQDVSCGDFDGDGFGDIAASSPTDSSHFLMGNGSVYVVYGRSDFAPGARIDVSEVDLTVRGEVSGERLGWSIAAGDVNKDGKDDLVMGEPYFDYPLSYGYGRVSVLFGGGWPPKHEFVIGWEVPDLTIKPRIDCWNVDRAFGKNVACGDVNGDGVMDIAVEAETSVVHNHSDVGRLYVLYGRPSFRPPVFMDMKIGVQSWVVDGNIHKIQNFEGGLSIGDVTGEGEVQDERCGPGRLRGRYVPGSGLTGFFTGRRALERQNLFLPGFDFVASLILTRFRPVSAPGESEESATKPYRALLLG